MSVTPDDGRTHWHGCEQEHGHHACALAELARLRGEVGELRAWQREAAGYLTQVRDTLAASGRVRHLHVDALLARVKP